MGCGDADPSNVSPLVHGAEMRVPRPGRSTGPCARPTASASARSKRSGRLPNLAPSPRESKKLPPQPVNGKNGNYGGPQESATVSASSVQAGERADDMFPRTFPAHLADVIAPVFQIDYGPGRSRLLTGYLGSGLNRCS